jgi:serralysin
MCLLCAALHPDDPGAQWTSHAGAPSTSAASLSQLEQIAEYLRAGYWADVDVNNSGADELPRHFYAFTGETLTYDVTGLSNAERFIAISALQAWTDGSGLKFRAVSNPTFREKAEGSDAGGDTATQKTIAINQQMNGTIAGPNDSDAFKVTLEAGADYLVMLNRAALPGNKLDGVITVTDADGNEILKVDAAGLKPEMMSFSVAATGDYFIRVDGFGRTTGKYELLVKQAADIVFGNGDSGAYSTSDIRDDGYIRTSYVNVQKNWDSDPISLNSYWFQTYIHEIGHALGLGHAGNYNGDAKFGLDHTFDLDSWQASVMSYFSQTDNPNVDASYAFLASIMPADILAIQEIYGANITTRTGDTVYGHNSNLTGYLRQICEALFDGTPVLRRVFIDNPMALTIFDAGGTDTLDFSTVRFNQRINLVDGTASSIGGLRGNFLIAPGTIIENALGGRGIDRISGNDAANRLTGRSGDDALSGGVGNDTLNGGSGADKLNGGTGNDTAVFYGDSPVTVNLADGTTHGTATGSDSVTGIENVISGAGNDRLIGNAEGNTLTGNAGNDILNGGDGTDSLIGGSGNDILRGEGGDDRMIGGTGTDSFVFTTGLDLIYDFTDDEDTIHLGAALWGGTAMTLDMVLAMATVQFGNLVFAFGDGNELTIFNLDDKQKLLDDLVLDF